MTKITDEQIHNAIIASGEIIDVNAGTTQSFTSAHDAVELGGQQDKTTAELARNFSDRETAYLGALDRLVRRG